MLEKVTLPEAIKGAWRIGERFRLRDLPDGPVNRGEQLPSCGLFCEMAEQEYTA